MAMAVVTLARRVLLFFSPTPNKLSHHHRESSPRPSPSPYPFPIAPNAPWLPTWERFSLRGPFDAGAYKGLEMKQKSNLRWHTTEDDGTTTDYNREQWFLGRLKHAYNGNNAVRRDGDASADLEHRRRC